MVAEAEIPVEERIRQLLRHLGIEKAHFAARDPGDWIGLATRCPEIIESMTLICPLSVDSSVLLSLSSRLLVFIGSGDSRTQAVAEAVQGLPQATLVTFPGYAAPAWADVIADFSEEISAAMLSFLDGIDRRQRVKAVQLSEGAGELGEIFYTIEGTGPPLVLLPQRLAASQWEQVLQTLSRRYCTITLTGPRLGFVAVLETRGSSPGYLAVVSRLMDEAEIQPGEVVLDVGCGTGVLDRWLAGRTNGANPIVGVDANRYLLSEASALARREGLESALKFQEANAEALPFPDNSFDVTMSITVLEEGDADAMLAEFVRVTRPGGRLIVMVRALDVPWFINLPLEADLKSKLERAGGSVEPLGCADASLYRRVGRAGFTQVRMSPQMAVFCPPFGQMGQFLQNRVAGNLSSEEQEAYRAAEAQAMAAGTFFYAWPHHCAVGTRP